MALDLVAEEDKRQGNKGRGGEGGGGGEGEEEERKRFPVHILTDSQYCAGSLDLVKNWKAKKNMGLISKLKAQLAEMRKAGRIEIHWVKAHAGVQGNERADELANEGVKRAKRGAAMGEIGDMRVKGRGGTKRKPETDVSKNHDDDG